MAVVSDLGACGREAEVWTVVGLWTPDLTVPARFFQLL